MTQNDNRKEYIPAAWEEVPCPICGSTQKKTYERFGPALQYTYVLCRLCKNVYQSPRPIYDDRFLQAAYANYFVFSETYEYKPSTYNDFNKEIDEILTFDRRATSILDVGCAMGDFLYNAKNRYPNVSGVEISEKMARFVANKLSVKIYKEQFAELKTAERFSCIHMSHVIEHVPHPNDWLRKARELLMPDGILVINVPNMFSFSRIVKLLLKRIGVRKGTWGSAWRTPDHLFEPTISSMLFFLKKGGFEVLSIYSYSRSNMISQGIGGLLFHRLFKSGSNIRVYARPI